VTSAAHEEEPEEYDTLRLNEREEDNQSDVSRISLILAGFFFIVMERSYHIG
jgi:hypothetical protein